jgi:hypothetical protein
MCLNMLTAMLVWLVAAVDAPRLPNDFVSMNKEGICSLPGYWAVHLIGTTLGAWLLSPCSSATPTTQSPSLAAASARNGGADALQGTGGHAHQVPYAMDAVM